MYNNYRCNFFPYCFQEFVYFFLVGNDVEIKFKPGNNEEHVKESTSEEQCDDQSSSNIFPSPPPKKVFY